MKTIMESITIMFEDKSLTLSKEEALSVFFHFEEIVALAEEKKPASKYDDEDYI